MKEKKSIFQVALKRRMKLIAKLNDLMLGSVKGVWIYFSHTPVKASEAETTSSLMKNLMGLLRVHVKQGKNLAIRDLRTSDPYVVLKMGDQKLKSRKVKNDVNPKWDDDLTLSITDPSLPIKLKVYDHDTFSMDDKMGDAEFDIMPYIEAIKKNSSLEGNPSGTVISRLQPSEDNCLAEESEIYLNEEGKILQDLCLKLRNVECGEVEIQLEWIQFPGCKMS